MRQVVKLRAYPRLLAAYTLNELAWAIGSLTLAVLVYRRTGSAFGAMAYFLAAQFVPALVAPAVVSRLDRLHARFVLPSLYAVEAFAFAALSRQATSFWLIAVLVLTLLDGAAALAARSLARATTVAVTAPACLLREGNALTNASFSVCFMLGPAVGGALVLAVGTAATLLINSGLFVLIALTLLTAPGLPGPPPSDAPARGRLRAGIAYARGHPGIRALLALQGAAVVFFTISVPVDIVFARHSLHTGAAGYGALLSAWGAGAIVGSAVYARWRAVPGRILIALGAGLLGVGFVVMAAAPSLAMAVVGSAIGGAGNGIEVVAARTELQEQAQARWMALMMSLADSIMEAAPGLGIVAGGALAALFGPRAALALGGLGALLIPVGALVLLRPGGRGAPSPHTDPHGGHGSPSQATASR